MLRGLSVALIEKGDFASGTSSRSSKLVHGGLRYLKGRHVRLVRESLRERGVLLKIAPHLVEPAAFYLPVYAGGRDGRLKLRLGLTAYDLLAGFGDIGRHTVLSREQMLEAEPLLRPEGLQGGFRYFDCVVNDARLTLATLRSAIEEGAVALNYVEATGMQRDGERVSGVTFRDTLSGKTGAVSARVVVNATGPWADRLREMAGVSRMLSPTKGIHLVLSRARLGLSTIVVIPRADRILFAVPCGDSVYVGTTDTFYDDDPGAVAVDAADASYVLERGQRAVPQRARDGSGRRRRLGRRAAVGGDGRSASAVRRVAGLRDRRRAGGDVLDSRRQADHLPGDGGGAGEPGHRRRKGRASAGRRSPVAQRRRRSSAATSTASTATRRRPRARWPAAGTSRWRRRSGW